MGIEFDPPNATAYMLVGDGAGGFSHGPGPAYVWSVKIDQPTRSTPSGPPVFNFSNTWTNSLLAYLVSGATADAGCVTALHMTSVTSGIVPNQADFILSGYVADAGFMDAPAPSSGD